MGELLFTYGTMGSAKSASALIEQYDFESINKKVLLVKPDIDDREGTNIIKSRIGLQKECKWFSDFLLNSSEYIKSYDVIIIDECQFLNKTNIQLLVDIVENHDIIIHCYGLLSDFRGEIFESSSALLVYSDKVNVLSNRCWCGKEAKFNARVINNKIVTSGEQFVVGDECYIPLCRHHYILKQPFKS